MQSSIHRRRRIRFSNDSSKSPPTQILHPRNGRCSKRCSFRLHAQKMKDVLGLRMASSTVFSAVWIRLPENRHSANCEKNQRPSSSARKQFMAIWWQAYHGNANVEKFIRKNIEERKNLGMFMLLSRRPSCSCQCTLTTSKWQSSKVLSSYVARLRKNVDLEDPTPDKRPGILRLHPQGSDH